MKTWSVSLLLSLCSVSLILGVAGCGGVSETAQADALTMHVGSYPPPPAGAARPRVGVPPFKVSTQEQGGQFDNLNDVAADAMTSLAVLSGRFVVIERARLDQLLREQGLEGIVTPGEMARPGQVRGVDYLIIGKITNLRVSRANVSRGFGLGHVNLPGGGNLGGLDVQRRSTQLKVDCGVDIRLVDPTTGEVVAAHFGEFQRIDEAKAMGVVILGASAEAEADIEIDADSHGKIFRLALDEALRKMLPQVDRALVTRAPAAPAAAAPAQGARFCGQCGQGVQAGVKFCGGCGAGVQ